MWGLMTKVKIYAIILFFLLCPIAIAGQQQGAGEPQGASCTTANDSERWAPVDQSGGSNRSNDWVCGRVVIAAAITVTGYNVAICDDGTNVGSITMKMFNDSGDEPNEASEIANSSINSAMSTLPDCSTYTKTFIAVATPFVLSAGTYHLCSDEVDSAVRLVRLDESSNGDRECYSADGSTFTCNDNQSVEYEVYGCLN